MRQLITITKLVPLDQNTNLLGSTLFTFLLHKIVPPNKTNFELAGIFNDIFAERPVLAGFSRDV